MLRPSTPQQLPFVAALVVTLKQLQHWVSLLAQQNRLSAQTSSQIPDLYMPYFSMLFCYEKQIKTKIHQQYESRFQTIDNKISSLGEQQEYVYYFYFYLQTQNQCDIGIYFFWQIKNWCGVVF